jgi:DNA-nicking Smr family endonuclease
MSELPARGRPLSDEEVELWLTVTRGVARRPGRVLPESPRSGPERPTEGRPPPPPPPPTAPLESRRPVLPSLAPIDRRARQKLARGHMPIEAAIDLHGMRQQEAHHALHGFLSRAQRDGAKIVLVVTGKGESHPAEGLETGVLRRSVPLWLRAPEWRSLVVGFEEASRPHGGAGALYVRLRRGSSRRI